MVVLIAFCFFPPFFIASRCIWVAFFFSSIYTLNFHHDLFLCFHFMSPSTSTLTSSFVLYPLSTKTITENDQFLYI